MAPGDETRPDNRPVSPLFNDGPADETTVSRNPVPPPHRGGDGGGRRQPVSPPPGTDTPPYVQAPAYQQPYDDDAGLFGEPAGRGPDGRPTILANQADGWESNLQEVEVVRSSRTGLVLLFLLALLIVALLALGLAARSVFGGGGGDSATDTGDNADATSTTLTTETTQPLPSITTTTVVDPATQLRVTVAEDPFLCDGGTREFALIAGADPNETIAFSSPQTGDLRSGTADANGELPIRWQCEPTQAGTTWELTATGDTSGRTITFIFAGVSSPGDGSATPTTGGTETTQTTTATPTALAVQVTEDPFVCNGEVRAFAAISGAAPNESVAFSSPQSSGLRSGQADADGNLSVRWQCDPEQVGTVWELTATGETSGATVTFSFTGG